LTLSEKDLAELVYSGLLSHLKEKLEGYEFQDVSQVLQRALALESRAKESRNFQKSNDKFKVDRPNVHMLEYESENSDDDDADVCVVEWHNSYSHGTSDCNIFR
jgi:hypothetical protein